MRTPWPIIHLAKSLLNAKTKEKEQNLIYHIRCAVDDYEDELLKED